MSEELSPEAYRRIANEFRARANMVRDPKQSADALKMAEEYESRATAADAKLEGQLNQLRTAN